MRGPSLILILALVVSAISRAEGGETHEIAAMVAARQIDGSWGLEITVTNRTSNTIVIPRASLPWLCPKDLLVLAEEYRIEALSSSLSNRTGRGDFECPGGGYAIDEGTSASGFVDLRQHVDRLDEALRDHDVVLFWFWRLRIEGRPQDEKHGGYQIIRAGSDEDSGAATLETTGIPSIIVDAVPMDELEPASLGFILSNDGSETVSIAFTDVPWLALSRIILRAGALNPPRSIAKLGAIRDVRGVNAWLTLPPRGHMTGLIPLHKRFVGWDEVRNDHDIVVFWLYSGRSTDGVEIGPRGGFVLFPRRE